jgi:hypothetical protein
MIAWLPLVVLAASLAARALHVPGSVTWTALFVLLIALVVFAPLGVAALVGIAGLIGLGGGFIVRSVREGMSEPVE